jgi:hypothetical protein
VFGSGDWHRRFGSLVCGGGGKVKEIEPF